MSRGSDRVEFCDFYHYFSMYNKRLKSVFTSSIVRNVESH